MDVPRSSHWRFLTLLLAAVAAVAVLLLAALAEPASARKHVLVVGASHQVTRGAQAFLDVRVLRAARCRLEASRQGVTRRSRVARSRGSFLRFVWRVPADAAPGDFAATIRCSRFGRGRLRQGAASLRLTVAADTPGSGFLFDPRRIRINAVSLSRPARGGGLTVAGAPVPAENGFTTYWPLPTRTQTRIEQGPNETFSHNNAATRNGVDLGVPAGTEIRAGFSGTVERTVTHCAPVSRGCGDTFGNYVLLRAVDGTCAVHAHLSRVDVSPQQAVGRYALLGLSGSTGTSTAAHLHYDRVECGRWQSLPWAPLEGGSLAFGTTIVSQNTPEPQCTALQGGCVNPQTTTNPQPTAPSPQPSTQPTGGSGGGSTQSRVNAYDNYGPAVAGHAMCRGNPDRPESMPGGTVSQVFTVPTGVRSIDSAVVQIDPDARVNARATLSVNGAAKAATDAAAAGDTHFAFPSVSVTPGDLVRLSISFTATYGKLITVYSAGSPGGTLTASNSCSDGAPSFSSTAAGLRAVLSGSS